MADHTTVVAAPLENEKNIHQDKSNNNVELLEVDDPEGAIQKRLIA